MLGRVERTQPRNPRALAGSAPVVGFQSFGEAGLADDGVSRFNNAIAASLALGRRLSATAEAVQEAERLRQEQSQYAIVLEKRIEERTEQLRRRDAILAAIAGCATKLLASSPQCDVDRVLELLGQAVGADAVWAFENQAAADDSCTLMLKFEWSRPGIIALSAQAGQHVLSLGRTGDQLVHELYQNHPVQFETSRENRVLCGFPESVGARSLLLVPVLVKSEFRGVLGFAHMQEERHWTSLEIDAMRLLATMLASAIGHKAAMPKIASLARTDALTGLSNRSHFQEQLASVLIGPQRKANSAALLFIDLDGLKVINDTLGHAVGDEILRSAAARLIANLDIGDIAARLGGDEFAVLQIEPRDRGAVEALASRILAAIGLPHIVGNRELTVNASIGIALAEGSQRFDQLLARADLALYEAKAAGRGTFRLFHSRMEEKVRLRRRLEAIYGPRFPKAGLL